MNRYLPYLLSFGLEGRIRLVDIKCILSRSSFKILQDYNFSYWINGVLGKIISANFYSCNFHHSNTPILHSPISNINLNLRTHIPQTSVVHYFDNRGRENHHIYRHDDTTDIPVRQTIYRKCEFVMLASTYR